MNQYAPSAAWNEMSRAWRAVIVIPFTRAVWRGGVYKDWSEAMAAAEQHFLAAY